MTTSFSKLAHHWRLMGCNYTSTMISACFHIWSAPGIRDPTCLVLVGPYGNTNFYTSFMSISIIKIYRCCRGLRFGGLELEVWASKIWTRIRFCFWNQNQNQKQIWGWGAKHHFRSSVRRWFRLSFCMPFSVLHWFSMFFMNFKTCEGQPCMSFITNV